MAFISLAGFRPSGTPLLFTEGREEGTSKSRSGSRRYFEKQEMQFSDADLIDRRIFSTWAEQHPSDARALLPCSDWLTVTAMNGSVCAHTSVKCLKATDGQLLDQCDSIAVGQVLLCFNVVYVWSFLFLIDVLNSFKLLMSKPNHFYLPQ